MEVVEVTPGGSRALQRGLGILGLFTAREPTLTVRTISERLGVPIATTYRLIRTLVDADYLAEQNGNLTLGMEAVRLGSIATAGNDLLTLAGPMMRMLAEATGETAVVVVPGERAAVCVGVVEGTSPIRPRSARVGEDVPYNGGATPIALLAFLDSASRSRILAGEFERFTNRTPAQPAEIERLCQEVRAVGYAHSESAYIEGTAATAAPIFDRSGHAVASIGVTGITERVQDVHRIVCDTADEITVRLGGQTSARHASDA